jgi:hypothetical protein
VGQSRRRHAELTLAQISQKKQVYRTSIAARYDRYDTGRGLDLCLRLPRS